MTSRLFHQVNFLWDPMMRLLVELLLSLGLVFRIGQVLYSGYACDKLILIEQSNAEWQVNTHWKQHQLSFINSQWIIHNLAQNNALEDKLL